MKKKVLILGASSDIGLIVASYFLRENFEVYAHYNKSKPNINSQNIKFLKYDFKNENSINKFLSKIKNIYFCSFINLIGYIDNKKIEETKLKILQDSLRVNFLTPILIGNYVARKMIKKNYGRLLHCSSIGVKFGGGINTYTYSLSKHCLEFIPSYYKNISKHNILYNVLRIGVTNTKIHKKIPKKNLNNRISKIPLKRIAKPEEIAKYIYYLCSDENSYIANQILNISGGE